MSKSSLSKPSSQGLGPLHYPTRKIIFYRNLENHWTNIWKSDLTQSPCSDSHQKQMKTSMKLCLFETMLLISLPKRTKPWTQNTLKGWRYIIHRGHLQHCAPRAGSSSERPQTGPNRPPLASLLCSLLLGFTCHYSSFTKFSKSENKGFLGTSYLQLMGLALCPAQEG